MKVLAKAIEMITVTNEAGVITPIRFKFKNEDASCVIIKIDKIIFTEKERIAGNYMLLYRCKSLIDDVEKIYELKYELSSCKWLLFKM